MTSAEDIKKLGTILGIWAHPDDETFCAAGIMAQAVKNGQTVVCVTATKGEKGVQDTERWPVETLGETRAQELDQAMKTLGITQHHWLDYHDGECNEIEVSEACEKLQKLIEQYKPDSILTFGPEGMTGHPDHATVSRWVAETAKRAAHNPTVYHVVQTPEQYEKYFKKLDEQANIFFNIDQPKLVGSNECDIYFELSPELRDTKHQALAAMPSQTEKLLKLCDDELFQGAFGIEAFVKAR
jgi:LmbE family N-acetylglucosaminyl deacetylase